MKTMQSGRTYLDADDTIYSVKVKELKEKPGKPIYLTFKGKDYQLLADKRCVGNTDEDNICKTCKLKFRCFTGDALRINLEDDLANIRIGDQEPTITEIIDLFLQSKGVDLTKLAARAKIVEDEAKKAEEDAPDVMEIIGKMMGGLRNQLKCPSCGHIFPFDYTKDTGKYECPDCGHKWSKKKGK